MENTEGMISGVTQTMAFNGFNKIQSITDFGNGYNLGFTYGPDQERWKTVLKQNGNVIKTAIFAGDYEQITENGVTRRLYYLDGGAIYVKQDGKADKVYYTCTDHLGSIMKLVETDGTEVFAATYDAWGKQTVTNNTFAFHRGYTGHEHLPEFSLINMNGRLYDPVIGRFLSPDPYVQMPDFSQNFNRYSYCVNNPLKFTDPSGELFVIDDIIFAAIVGSMFNVAMQGIAGNINSLGDFGKAFGIGALAGAGGAFVGGTVAGAIGYGGFAGGATVGASAGFTAGFIGGSGNSWMNGTNLGDGLVAGLKGGLVGGISGALIGGAIGGIDAIKSSSNFWNGKVNEVGGSGSGKFLNEEIPAGAKPTATGEIAETSTNPNYGKYGMTRNGGAKAHYGVDYVGKEGDDVFAMYDGNVIKIGGSKAYGDNFVRTSSSINGKTYNVDYGHMSKNFVSINKMATAGQKIGEIGRLGNLTGTSFPTHVHIAIWRPVNGLQGFVMPWWK